MLLYCKTPYCKPVLWALFILVYLPVQAQSRKPSKPSYTLSGMLKNASNRKIYLREHSFFKNENRTDSTVADKNGRFVFRGSVHEPTYFLLQTNANTSAIGFYIENISMTITGDTKTLWEASIHGSREEDIRRMYDKAIASVEYASMEKQREDAIRRQDSLAIKQANQYEQTLLAQEKKLIWNLVQKYPYAASSINQLGALIDGRTSQELQRADSLIRLYESSHVAHYEQVKFFKKKLAIARQLVVGQIAPDFVQQDTAGLQVHLSDFKGKYVLVDFWASWCSPCRQESPYLVKAYQQFKNKNFTILSISLDKNATNWQKAITADKLTWTHVSDLNFWKNAVAVQYSVDSIPFNLLLDPAGKIIALNLRTDAIEETLKAVLK
ncbi:TlpA disulfide reductase family protein [Xanthocytophaga agilis]|uniref:TlpA disulfide reductase family protein n=1 Tax=Xanthocytophaga agilis TaxID=3048010 RepID=A0AAE3R264_9BACT|nr:TlpA disulfide reductase family protein [Xanthocytophaga agilis]MDJ1500217.1 TlpA disulfide reductase family protein [Xanthocytophaga agilis]